ncbi:MAG: amidohydrolase family protein [Promethearchaeota archaeon]
MNKLIIKNGIVVDPADNINGESKDILIENGIVVDNFSKDSDIIEINASGKTVVPAALDIHAHVASQQVNWARLLGRQDKQFQEKWNGLRLESIARDYISNGYTFFLEANVFPSLAKQTIFNFSHIPVLDKAMLINASNLWPLELEYQRSKTEDIAVFISDLLKKTKSFGIKAYNPFESETWNFKKIRNDLTVQGRLYNFNALDVYISLTKTNEYLKLPHSVHAHIEGYETDQGTLNLPMVLEKIKSLELHSLEKRKQVFHIAHANSYNIQGNNESLIKFLNNNQDFDIDVGMIDFNGINPLITSDRNVINNFRTKNPNKPIISAAIELEGDSFTTLRSFDKNKESDCFLWANAIELTLKIKNKYQIQLATNFPNYSNISNLPEIATWLLNKDARNAFMEGMNQDFLKKSYLQDNQDVLSFEEYITITRASPARSLGLDSIKGTLKAGADGDINIFNFNVNTIDFNKKLKNLREVFEHIDLVIKGGEIIKNKDIFNLNQKGNILWSKGRTMPLEESEQILSKKKEFYMKNGSILYESFEMKHFPNEFREI